MTILSRLAAFVARNPLLAFALFLAFFLAASAPLWYGEFRLGVHGRETLGTVVRKTPEEHWTVVFRFQVGSRTFSGVGKPGTGGLPAMEDIRVGAPVRVTYDPSDPAISRSSDPDRRFWRDYGQFLLVVTVASAGATAILRGYHRLF